MIGAWWDYRAFIGGEVRREFHSRYTRSVLGGVWAILDPLAMIAIYTLIFSQVMQARLPGSDDVWSYGIYICIGVITWEYFAELINRGLNMFMTRADLLKKTNFPRSILPVVQFLGASLNFAIIFSLFMLILLLMGRFPGWALLAMAPLLAIQAGIALGLGLILGTLNVFFRDLGQGMGIVLRFWFWLTPIVYPLAILPANLQNLLATWNPMVVLLTAHQQIVLHGALPVWRDFLPHLAAAVLLLGVGYLIFTRLSGEMVDEL